MFENFNLEKIDLFTSRFYTEEKLIQYLKENGITKANKITPTLALGFLEQKAQQGASSRTLLCYKSALIKIDNAIKMLYITSFNRGSPL